MPDALEQLILQAPHACGAAPPAAATAPPATLRLKPLGLCLPRLPSGHVTSPGPAPPGPAHSAPAGELRSAERALSRVVRLSLRVGTPGLVSRLGRQATPRTPLVLPKPARATFRYLHAFQTRAPTPRKNMRVEESSLLGFLVGEDMEPQGKQGRASRETGSFISQTVS